jgi:hypothetical protein
VFCALISSPNSHTGIILWIIPVREMAVTPVKIEKTEKVVSCRARKFVSTIIFAKGSVRSWYQLTESCRGLLAIDSCGLLVFAG